MSINESHFIEPSSVYSLLLNTDEDSAARHIQAFLRDKPHLMAHAQFTFDVCVAVYRNHRDDIRLGTPFLKLFNQYAKLIHDSYQGKKTFDLPSAKEQAQGLLSSATKIIKSGWKKVGSSEYEERLNTCRKCEFLWPGSEDMLRCGKCGCMMKLKAKYAAMHCPIDKW